MNESMHTNETLHVINNRVSLRRFAERPVSDEHRDLIIHSAMRAPTAGNMMLYSILVVDDPAKKQRLSETCDHQPFIATAPLVIIFLADMQRWFDYYTACGVSEFCRMQGRTFYGPTEGDLLLACADALIAAQNAVIAAESLGIGSCYIGDIMEQIEIHREMFNLPEWVFPIGMLCFGYYPEGPRPQPRPRYDHRYIVFHDEYHRFGREELIEMNADRKFPADNQFGAQNYGQWKYARKTGADFSREMARSVRKALESWQGKEIK